MRIFIVSICLAAMAGVLAPPSAAGAAGDAARGQNTFLKCVACHSAQPGVNKTGPSLAGVFGRKAGTVEGFNRYSEALRNSDVAWNDESLDSWLKDPRRFIPGNLMNFPGLAKESERRDIVAYLKQLAAGEAPAASGRDAGRGGMMGSMGASELSDISKPRAGQQVTSVRYCRDTYQVTTADGKTLKFWEFNLRIKTDSTDKGPPDGKPVLLPAGMMGGDRSFLVFRSPREISGFIEEKC